MSTGTEKIIAYRLEQAGESLGEAEILLGESMWRGAINRLYYACFYAASAVLLSRSLSSKKHSGIRSLFGKHLVRTGAFPEELALVYNRLYDHRMRSDYADLFEGDAGDLAAYPDPVRRFIAEAERLVHEGDS